MALASSKLTLLHILLVRGLRNRPKLIRWSELIYRGEKNGLQILPSYSQTGPDRKAKQGLEEISSNLDERVFANHGDATLKEINLKRG